MNGCLGGFLTMSENVTRGKRLNKTSSLLKGRVSPFNIQIQYSVKERYCTRSFENN